MKTWGRTAAVLAAATLGVSLAGCTQGGETPAEETEELSFLLVDNGEAFTTAFESAADGFESETGISVEIETFSSDDYDGTIDTRLQAGADGPDFYLVRPARIPDYVEGGYLAPLDGHSWFTALQEGAQAAPNAVQDGVPYAFPIAKSGNDVIYNKALFDQAGITTVPTTLSELEAAAQSLQAAGITPFAMSGQDSWWLQFILFHATAPLVLAEDPANGQEIMSGEKTFTGDAGWTESLEIFEQLSPYYVANPLGTSFDAAKAAFLDGTAAMFPAPWILPDVASTDLDVGAMVFPVEDGGQSAMWGDFPYLFGINPQTGNEDAAAQFAEYLFSSGVYDSVLEGVAAFPVVDGVDAPDIALGAERQANYEGKEFFGSPNDVWLPGVGDVLTTELQNLLAGQSTVEQVLAALDAAVADAQ